MDENKYNPNGINYVGPAMNKAPTSNQGLVFNPANKPNNPGNLKVGQQLPQNNVWTAPDGTYINIGNQDGTVGIVIYNADGTIAWELEAGISFRVSSNTADTALVATNDDGGLAAFFGDAGTGTDNIVEIDMANSANTNSPLEILNAKVYNSHFRKMLNLQGGVIWVGDATTSPNTVLTGNKGDFLIGGDGGHPYYCTANASTSWTQI